MNAKNRQQMRKPALLGFLVLLALLMGSLPFVMITRAAPPGYYVDQDNEDNAGSGSADGDMGGVDAPLVGASDAIHPIEFNIDVPVAPGGDEWYLGFRLYDIDPDEEDTVYLNDVEIGTLWGDNEAWSTNNFTVTDEIVQGTNTIRIEVEPGWVARVQFGVLHTAPLGEVYNLSVTPAGEGSGTVTSDPPGIDCGGDCFEVYALGEVITMTAAADPNSVFTGWSGDPDCDDGVVTLNADTSCTANFDDVLPTTTTLSSSPNPSVYGQSLIFTATVAATTTPNEGTVTFQIDGMDVPGCVGVPVVNGQATCVPGVLDAGTYAVTAAYSGSLFFLPSSDTMDGDQTVEKADTSVGLVSAANPSMYGSLVTFTATVTTDLPGMGVPVGTISFYDGSTFLQTIPLDGTGQAAFTTVYPLAVGAHKIHATYSGSDNFNNSASPILLQRVEWATDLSIEKSLPRPQITDLVFTIVARNRACCCIAAPGAIISDTLPAYYSNATWICEAAGGAECGAASGEGDIYDTLSAFPPGGVVTYTLSAQYTLPGEGYIRNTAEIIAPEGVSDIDMSNNSVTIERWIVLLPVISAGPMP